MSDVSGGEPLRLPEFVLEEAARDITLQNMILDLAADEVETVADSMMATVAFENVEAFVSRLLLGVEYRPGKADLYARFLNVFLCANRNEAVVEKTKKIVLERLFSFCYLPLTYPQPLRYSQFAFLCFKHGIFTDSDLVCAMKFYTLGTHLDQMAINISWLAPEIWAGNPRFYADHSSIILKHCADLLMPTVYSDYEKNFSDFELNKWEMLRKYRELGCNPMPLCQIIAHDNVDELRKLIVDEAVKVNARIVPSVYEPFWILNCFPTVIQYAAGRGSVRCFRYLLLCKANLRKKDKRGRRIEQFAIFGGNLEIIRLLEENGFEFEDCLRFCVMYHRNSIGEWIERSKCVSDVERASILANGAVSDNVDAVLKGLSRKNDVNAVDNRGEVPITETIVNGSYSCFKVLLSHPDIDLSVSGAYGTLLQTAVQFGRSEMVSKLLMYNSEPVDAVTETHSSCLHVAVEQNFSYVVDVLLQQPNVDVNVLDLVLGTPIELAVVLGNCEAAASLLKSPLIDLTVAYVRPNLTPIMLAVSLSDVKMVSLLLSDHRTNIHGPNGTTNFLFFAVKNSLAAMVELLLGRPELDINMFQGVSFSFIRSLFCL